MALINNLSKRSNAIFIDETTKRKIERHLSDINDVITDQDIKNVRTDVIPPSENGAERERDSNRDNNNSNSIETPWNVLD